MYVFERAVRFEDVDAAGIVFFPRFLSYCHEAMEALCATLDGGYAGLVVDRKIGMPAVHVEVDFISPLRFGDTVRIEVVVEQIGRTSATFRYALSNPKSGAAVAVVRHVVVVSDLRALAKLPIPNDVRALLEQHLAAARLETKTPS